MTILYDEPRVLLVPRDHRLAGKESVTLDDIAGEPMPRLPDPAWNAYWRIDPRPDGTPVPDGPLVAARGRPDRLETVLGYLRELSGETGISRAGLCGIRPARPDACHH